MKKIFKDKFYYLSPIILYWDDIEYLFKNFEQLGKKIKIVAGEYEYSSLEEFKSKITKNFLREIEISIPGLSIHIMPTKVEIYTSEENFFIAAGIKEILSKKSPWYLYAFGQKVLVLVLLTSFIFFWLIERNDIIFLIYLYAFYVDIRKEPWIGKSRIYKNNSTEKNGFWERNSDNILSNFCSTLLFAICSYVFFNIV